MCQKTVSFKFPRQANLQGKLRQHDITYEELGNAIGMTASGVEAILNGRVDFKLSIVKKIQVYLFKKTKIQYSLTDILE